MRYRFFEGILFGRTQRMMAFESKGKVFSYELGRSMYGPMPEGVRRLEDVTGAEWPFEGPVTAGPIHETSETNLHKVYRQVAAPTPQ